MADDVEVLVNQVGCDAGKEKRFVVQSIGIDVPGDFSAVYSHSLERRKSPPSPEIL